MKARLSDLLSNDECKKLVTMQLVPNKRVEELRVKDLSKLFLVLKDFNETPTGYVISARVLEILTLRALKKDIAIF